LSQEPPAPQAGDAGSVTPIGARRTSIADLQREVERLTAALQQAEQRRRAAEETLADVAGMAAADAADLRARLAALEQERNATGLTGGWVRSALPRRGRGRWARLRRALLIAGLVVGLLVVADGVLTIAWQEPITAIMQSRDQAALRSDLGDLQATFAAAPKLQRESEQRRIERQAGALLDARPAGAALGSIRIPRIGLKSVFVESTGHDALTKGPGHYKGTTLPGLPGTVGLAGHRTTYGAPFRHVDNLAKGTPIEVRMPYGRFIYRVVGTQITTPDDAAALRSRVTGAHLLVLTACHPLYSAAKRIVVTAHQTYAAPA
jgi:sortase A